MLLRRTGLWLVVSCAPIWGGCTAILGSDFKDGPLENGSVDGATADGTTKDSGADAGKDARSDARSDARNDAPSTEDARKDSPAEHDAGKDAPTAVDASDAGDASDASPLPDGSCDTDASYCASACVPKTCAQLQWMCGTPGDGCGGSLNCGSCGVGLSCGGDFGPGTCGMSTCSAQSCASQKIGCGPADDGCGNPLDCGTCPAGQTCGGGAQPSTCGSSIESCFSGTLEISGACPGSTPSCAKISLSSGSMGEACAACAPGATQCVTSQAQICNASGVWTSRAFCGPGGSSGTCVDDECVETIAVGTRPWGIAADAANVYWVDNGAPGIFQAPAAGGTIVTLSSMATGARAPTQIATDGTYVFWTDAGTTSNAGTVVRSKIGGGGLTTLVSGLSDPQGIAVGAGRVYWTDPTVGAVYSISSVGGGGQSPSTVATSANADAITVDTVSVYWATYTTIMKAPLGGGSATTVYAGQNYPSGIAAKGNKLYWTNNDAGGSSGSVVSGPSGGGVSTTLVTAQAGPTAITLNPAGTSLYWVNSTSPGEVMKLVLGAGGALTPLDTGLSFPQGIAVNATDAFWTTITGATVQKGPE